MGDMDLVRPLGLAGITSVVAAPHGSPAFHSRFVRKAASWEDDEANAEASVEILVRFGAAQPEPAVLFYEADSQLLLVSRYREKLAQVFRFVVADHDLVENLADKERFQALAERLRLPVPAACRIDTSTGSPSDIALRFPVVIKPARHSGPWKAIESSGKALWVDDTETLRALWPRLAAVDLDLLIQEAVPGPESCIESYHVYVDQHGATVAEFTGRKIRTFPLSCGHSTALETTDAADVRILGQEITRKLDLRGVAKFDFKRDPNGKLHLLEINPRFSLWHHLGAIAGVNMPALVYADLTGSPRPAGRTARAGIRWCKPWADVRAARACGMPMSAWLLWTLRCEAKSAIAWDDPVPLLQGALAKLPHRQAH
jgi:predicted ATP-grasp superfamily ATP-dependent carboligase